MSTSTSTSIDSRVYCFSLPAEYSAAAVLRSFIREIARSTNLSNEQVRDIQISASNAFKDALNAQKQPGEGRIALKIDAQPQDMIVNLTYRETHFPPAEILCLS